MADPIRWRVELATDRAASLAPELETLLCNQQTKLRRHMEAIRGRIFPPRTLVWLRWFGFGLAMLGFLLASFVCFRCRRPPIGSALMMGGFALTFLFLPKVEAWLLGLGQAMARRNAARLVAAIARLAPCTVEYELADGVLRGKYGSGGTTTRLADVSFAFVTDRFACLFRKPTSAVPVRMIHFDSPEASATVRSALVDAGIELGS